MEVSMRFLMYPAAAVAMTTVFLSLQAQAAHHRNQSYGYRGIGTGSGGFGTGPYWQGEPTDRLPIWRHGYYQGNDPDQFIRSQMMRDPVYGPWR
jgi:hypothetical protein